MPTIDPAANAQLIRNAGQEAGIDASALKRMFDEMIQSSALQFSQGAKQLKAGQYGPGLGNAFMGAAGLVPGTGAGAYLDRDAAIAAQAGMLPREAVQSSIPMTRFQQHPDVRALPPSQAQFWYERAPATKLSTHGGSAVYRPHQFKARVFPESSSSVLHLNPLPPGTVGHSGLNFFGGTTAYQLLGPEEATRVNAILKDTGTSRGIERIVNVLKHYGVKIPKETSGMNPAEARRVRDFLTSPDETMDALARVLMRKHGYELGVNPVYHGQEYSGSVRIPSKQAMQLLANANEESIAKTGMELQGVDYQKHVNMVKALMGSDYYAPPEGLREYMTTYPLGRLKIPPKGGLMQMVSGVTKKPQFQKRISPEDAQRFLKMQQAGRVGDPQMTPLHSDVPPTALLKKAKQLKLKLEPMMQKASPENALFVPEGNVGKGLPLSSIVQESGVEPKHLNDAGYVPIKMGGKTVWVHQSEVEDYADSGDVQLMKIMQGKPGPGSDIKLAQYVKQKYAGKKQALSGMPEFAAHLKQFLEEHK